MSVNSRDKFTVEAVTKDSIYLHGFSFLCSLLKEYNLGRSGMIRISCDISISLNKMLSDNLYFRNLLVESVIICLLLLGFRKSYVM